MFNSYWPLPLFRLGDFFNLFNRSFRAINGIYWVKSTSNSIAIICHNIISNSGRDVTLFLPGYFCGYSLRQVRSLQIKFVFYPIINFNPDYNFIREHHNKDSINILVFVHYFGKLYDQQVCLDFIKSNKFLLIEDCAHISNIDFFTSWIGDYVLFSPHKHYPVPEVGIILTKNHLNLKSDVFIFDWFWLLKQFFRILVKFKRNSNWGVLKLSDEVGKINFKQASNWVKFFSLSILENSQIDLNSKKYHLSILKEIMFPIKNWEPLIEFSENDYPFLYGFVCDNSLIAEKRFEILNNRCSLVLQWSGLPIEIKDSNNLFQECQNIVDNTLFFVLHGRLNNMNWERELLLARNLILESEKD